MLLISIVLQTCTFVVRPGSRRVHRSRLPNRLRSAKSISPETEIDNPSRYSTLSCLYPLLSVRPFALCPMLSAPCSPLSAVHSLPSALCSVLFSLRPTLSALCPLIYACFSNRWWSEMKMIRLPRRSIDKSNSRGRPRASRIPSWASRGANSNRNPPPPAPSSLPPAAP
jgi:hypothetical protein